MATRHEIEIIINEDGTVEIDQIGYKGKGCGEVAAKLAKALGTIVKQDNKCDYFQPEVINKPKTLA